MSKMVADNSDQWLLDGDCNLCRRQKYCSKPCTVKKRRTKDVLLQAVRSKFAEKTCGISEILMENMK